LKCQTQTNIFVNYVSTNNIKSVACFKTTFNRYCFCVYVEEFPAHNTDVTCLAIGHNSGLVLATGGADNNVNLWKVDDAKCFMVKYNNNYLYKTEII